MLILIEHLRGNGSLIPLLVTDMVFRSPEGGTELHGMEVISHGLFDAYFVFVDSLKPLTSEPQEPQSQSGSGSGSGKNVWL